MFDGEVAARVRYSGEGCVQSSTQTAGGVFQGDKVCVCVVCAFEDRGMNQCRGGKKTAIYWMVFTDQTHTCVFPSTRTMTFDLLCPLPSSPTHQPRATPIPHLNPPPHFKAFIYLVYHRRIWGIWWTISLLHPTVDEENKLKTQLTEKWKQKEFLEKKKKETEREVRGQFAAGNQKSPSPLLPPSFFSLSCKKL